MLMIRKVSLINNLGLISEQQHLDEIVNMFAR